MFTAPWVQDLFFFTLMYAALATAWNIVGGYSGYISLGHAAFFGVGAYATGITFTHISIGGGYRPFYVLPLIGIGVAIGSIPVGWVAYRTRAATFAIVTITLLFVGQQLAFNLRSLTGGSQGIAIPTPNFDVANYNVPFYFAMLCVLAVSLLASWYVRGSKLGLALLAVRDDEDRARGLGVQTSFAKLASFALSAGLVAMAGGVWAYYLSFIYPQFAIDPLVTIGMVLMVYLGGRGDAVGPGARGVHPGAGAEVPRLPARRQRSLSRRLLERLPDRDPAPAARDPALARRPGAQAAAPPGASGRKHEGGRRVVSALLEVDTACKRFGGVVAVDECTFSVEAGSITGLIGPNGSGKTTVFNLVTGYLPADSGSDPLRQARPCAGPTRHASRGTD